MSSFKKFIKKENSKKILFTPGPSSLLEENLNGLKPCFGRGDSGYKKIENSVLKKLKLMSSHKKIVRMQGSGSLAIEIMCHNFLYGNILILDTGFYSDRLKKICKSAKLIEKKIKTVKSINWKKMNNYKKNFDWVLACPTETSKGLHIPIKKIVKFSKKIKAKTMLDATGSFGLEKDHSYADVISYSSCKGLFGLTGASFIAFNNMPYYFSKTFYLNLKNHLKNKMTGPYHIILSLFYVLKKHESIKKSVEINKKLFCKKMIKFLVYPKENQPLLCTHVNKKITPKNKRVIIYKPRSKIKGSIICHLGEAHLGRKAKVQIINFLNLPK